MKNRKRVDRKLPKNYQFYINLTSGYVTFSDANGKKLPDWKATMTNKVTGETATVQHIKADYSWGRKTGAFFGGANNSPGEFGGVASQDMFLEYSFEIIK